MHVGKILVYTGNALVELANSSANVQLVIVESGVNP